MGNEDVCQQCICSDCINENADELWLVYYEQYYRALKILNQENCKSAKVLVPMVLMLAQYIEIWVKTIAINYGTGKCKKIDTEVVHGHNIDVLVQELIDIISEREWEINKEKIWEIDENLSWFNNMSDNGESLSIAMRYPVTKEGLSSLNPCIYTCLSGDCDKFNWQACCEKIERILELSYEVYDDIYNSRVG